MEFVGTSLTPVIRELHGALLDAEILAEVYLAMTGGQFSLMDFDAGEIAQKQGIISYQLTDQN